MLTDSERFAFIPRRLHGFASSGNAYDACQCDEAIVKGDTLVILPEGIVGIAWTWPIAVTAAHGALHSVADGSKATLAELAATFTLSAEDIRYAVSLARALHLIVDPAFEHACPTKV